MESNTLKKYFGLLSQYESESSVLRLYPKIDDKFDVSKILQTFHIFNDCVELGDGDRGSTHIVILDKETDTERVLENIKNNTSVEWYTYIHLYEDMIQIDILGMKENIEAAVKYLVLLLKHKTVDIENICDYENKIILCSGTVEKVPLLSKRDNNLDLIARFLLDCQK